MSISQSLLLMNTKHFANVRDLYARPDFSDPPFKIYVYDVLESSNTFLKEHLESFPDYSVIWAKEQTQGRGRFGRGWLTVPHKDLTFSVLVPLAKLQDPQGVPNFAQVAALAVAKMLSRHSLSPVIKWPNDVMLKQSKVSGILCELVRSPKAAFLILGIGINVNSSSEDRQFLEKPVVSMFEAAGQIYALKTVLMEVLQEIHDALEVFFVAGFQGIYTSLKKMLLISNQLYVLQLETSRHRGRILDLNEDGSLEFECFKHGRMTVTTGELSAEKQL